MELLKGTDVTDYNKYHDAGNGRTPLSVTKILGARFIQVDLRIEIMETGRHRASAYCVNEMTQDVRAGRQLREMTNDRSTHHEFLWEEANDNSLKIEIFTLFDLLKKHTANPARC